MANILNQTFSHSFWSVLLLPCSQ